MPTYDYQCRSCGVITEVVHSMVEDGPSTCERCGGELRRVFHPTGIIFKGGGFYKTDSRTASGGGSKANPSTSGASADSSSTTTPSKDGATADKGKSQSPSSGGDSGSGGS